MIEIIKILRERKKIIFILSGILFLFILSFYFSLAAKTNRKAKELDELRIQLKSVNENLQIFRELKVNKRLMSQEEASLVINNIARQCRSDSLELKSIIQKEKNLKDGYSILPVYLEIEGEFKPIGLFLGFLREFEDAVITVESFQMRRVDTLLPKIAGFITLNVYLSNE